MTITIAKKAEELLNQIKIYDRFFSGIRYHEDLKKMFDKNFDYSIDIRPFYSFDISERIDINEDVLKQILTILEGERSKLIKDLESF